MIADHARTLLSLRRAHQHIFHLKSDLSLEILLFIAARNNECPLKDLYRCDFATPVASRQHVSVLEQDGFVILSNDHASKRSKNIRLTDKALKKLNDYETIVTHQLEQWNYGKQANT